MAWDPDESGRIGLSSMSNAMMHDDAMMLQKKMGNINWTELMILNNEMPL